MFYLKLTIGIVWFIFCSVLTLLVSLIRWRHPSNGYLFTTMFTSFIHRLIGMKVVIRNKERLKDNQPCIYIGNHQSNFDMLTHACCYPPRTVAIGKKELIWIPLFGVLFLATGNIMLDRKNHRKAVAGLQEVERNLTKKNLSVYMFPEGTRSRNAAHMLPFKKGAFYMAINAGVPLVPVVATSVDQLIDLKRRKFHSGTVFIEVLDPIPTKGLTLDNVDSLIAEAQNKMQAVLNRIATKVN